MRKGKKGRPKTNNVTCTLRLDKNAVQFLQDFAEKTQIPQSTIVRHLIAEMRHRVANNDFDLNMMSFN